jgi:hypothetical protein
LENELLQLIIQILFLFDEHPEKKVISIPLAEKNLYLNGNWTEKRSFKIDCRFCV